MKKYIKCNLIYSPYYKKWKSFLKENVHGDVPEEVLMRTAHYLGSDEEVPMSLYDAFHEACRDCAPKGSELYEDWYNEDLRKYIPSEFVESSTRTGVTKRYIKSDAHKYKPISDSAVSDEYDVGDVILNLGNIYKSCVSSSGRAYLAPDTTIEIIDGNYAVVQDGEVILYDGEPTHITKVLVISTGLPVYTATTDNGDMFDLTLSKYRAGTRRW